MPRPQRLRPAQHLIWLGVRKFKPIIERGEVLKVRADPAFGQSSKETVASSGPRTDLRKMNLPPRSEWVPPRTKTVNVAHEFR